MIPWAHPSPKPKRHLGRFSHFCTDDRVFLYFTMGCPFPPQNCPLPWRDLDSHLIHGSLDPLESSAETVSQSVQPLLQPWLDSVTHRPTDHTTWSVITAASMYVVLGCGIIITATTFVHHCVWRYKALLSVVQERANRYAFSCHLNE